MEKENVSASKKKKGQKRPKKDAVKKKGPKKGRGSLRVQAE